MKSLPALPLLILLIVIQGVIPSAEAAGTLPSRAATLMQKNRIPASALSVAILPLTQSGRPTLINASASINPASTMKLVTTYSALEILGPTHQWRTSLYTDGRLSGGTLQGNLYVQGGGDPKLNLEKLWLLLRDLRLSGVQKIAGDLVLDRSYLRLNPNESFNDNGNNDYKPYLVGPDSLLVNLKALRFTARNEHGRISIGVDPAIDSVRIDNRVRSTGPTQRCPGWPNVHYQPREDGSGSTTVIVTGSIPQGCSGQTYMALLDHATYAGDAVRAVWKELGGSILGVTRQGRVPASAERIAQASSPDLVEIIRDINKYSNNTMARQLFLSIGARNRNAADANDAQAAERTIKQWMSRNGIAFPGLSMENGSGLSRVERVTAAGMANMLKAAWQSPFASEFIASMPIVAVDGTMRKRLRRTGVAGKAHIKTGTLKNVRAVAGFVQDETGETWAVVAILNHDRPWGGSSILDEIIVDVHNHPEHYR